LDSEKIDIPDPEIREKSIFRIPEYEIKGLSHLLKDKNRIMSAESQCFHERIVDFEISVLFGT